MKWIAPALALICIALMTFPVPAWMLDIFFTFNILISIVILLVALKVKKPAEFSIFPVTLLLATLLRLALNVASTRLILAEGHTGAESAGYVIESFGKFLLAGNFAVGFIVFIILLIINFIVITKGAGRIAEVSARFALDAMPGKQMAIDADLGAGLIGEEEAKRRRQEVGQEADFYGSMDGASKFVRGDAIAALLILVIAVIAGLAIGMIEHSQSFSEAANNYLSLAIGDAIAAQIPALLLSMAAGLIVSRAGSKEDLSDGIQKELLIPTFMKQAAIGLGLLGILPGMPNIPFLTFAALTYFFANQLEKSQNKPEPTTQETATTATSTNAPPKELTWAELPAREQITLEIGYRLVPLADPAQGGELLGKIKAARKRFATEMGFLPSTVHIRDNLELAPNEARFLLRGLEVARCVIYPDRVLAIADPAPKDWKVPGIIGKDPAFDMPALWIESQHESQAKLLGYTTVSPVNAICTLFSNLLEQYGADLLGSDDIQKLLLWHFQNDPKAVAEWVPSLVPLGTLRRILIALLEDHVPIRDLDVILSESSVELRKNDDIQRIVQHLRKLIPNTIVHKVFGNIKAGQAWVLNEVVEKQFTSQVQPNGAPFDHQIIHDFIQGAQQKIKSTNVNVLVVSDNIRFLSSKLLKNHIPDLQVIGFSEIPKTFNLSVVGKL